MNNAKNTTLFPYLERLLEGEAVEWKTLGEVCDYEQPTAYLVRNTNYSDQYPIPVLTAGKTFILGYTNETTGIYRASEHPTIIFDDFTTANKWVDFDFKAKSSAMKMLTSKDEKVCLLKYIYYWLNTLPADSIVGDHNRQWISNYAQRLFPLPPLRVQARIVEILDKFTQLEAELEKELAAELEARKKQYAYYRDQLLNFSQCPPLNVNIEWKTLGEVCHIVGRIGFRGYTRNDIVERGEGAISISPTNIINQHLNLSAEINTYISWEKYDESPEIKIEIGDIVLVKTGSTVGKTAIVRELIEKATINPQMVVLKEIQCSPAYLSHYINTPYFQLKLKSLCGQGSVPNISQTKLSTIPIPLPPLSEQRRIVDILDRFDTLMNSISEGLPKEITLRRKQYEYYRDALLNFPRAEVTA